MLLKIKSLDEFNSLRTYLLVAFIVVLLAGFVAFAIRSRKAENPATKRIKLGYGLFGLTYAMTRTLFLFSDYESAVAYPNTTQLHLIWVTAAYCVTFVSLLVIYATVERLILQRKPILTAIAAISFAMCLVAMVLTVFGVGLDLVANTGPHKIAQYTLYVTGPILAVGLALLYIIIVRNSTGSVRSKAALSLVGLILIFVGLFLDMDIYPPSWFDPIRYIAAPLAFIAGTVAFFVAQK
ncbi:MAG: hypothetical protein JW839_22115 [Candidatus Lokiarchaeota archaeon]|nr:hypothetical protein [Candidatus Lokiarchaeota archaeon]